MTYRVASDLAGTALARTRAKEFLPHLVCRWTLDPASHRLSCAWGAPTDRADIALLSARRAASRFSPGLVTGDARELSFIHFRGAPRSTAALDAPVESGYSGN
jgi:hypothetical protein